LLGVVGYKTVTAFIEEQAEKVSKKMDSTAVANLVKERLDKQITSIGKKELNNIGEKLNDSANVLFKIISNKIIALNQPGTLTQASTTSVVSNKVPAAMDLSSLLEPVGDQGNEGSVLGFAVAAALSGAVKKQENLTIKFSARYIYNNTNHHGDNGALYIDALNLLKNKGAVPEKYWPYVPGQYSQAEPSDLQKAPHYRISNYEKIDISIIKFKNLLASGKIIMIGMTMYQAYQTPDKNGVLPFYNPSFALLGGHAANIVGYNDAAQLLKLRFSWGTNFGDHGYCYLHYADISKVITEAYVIEKVINP